MTLLTIVQGVCQRLSLPQPSAAMGNSDPAIAAMVAFAQDAGDNLAERWDWQALKSYPIPSGFVGNGTQTLFALPVDFKNLTPPEMLISSVFTGAPLQGPVNDEMILQMKARGFTVAPPVWRRVGNYIEFYPALQSGETVTYDYESDYWVLDANGTTKKSSFTNDGDTSLIPERLLRLSILWQYRRSRGLDYAEEFAEFERALIRNKGTETQDRVILMAEPLNELPDNYFPQALPVR